jgi:uncharacterized membrane protein YkvA (DUF1232 family)
MKNEAYVKNGFWKKLKKAASHISFIEDAVAMYYCAIDPATPIHVKITAFTALAYFISPFDAIPDVIAIGGYADDAGVIITAIKILGSYITEEHRQKAKLWLGVGQTFYQFSF